MFRLPSLLMLFATIVPAAACLAQDDRGLESIHQPVVTAAGASVPGCSDWHGRSRDSVATTDSNYGCAVNGNLAAMIADPQDLLHGKSADDTDSVQAAKAYKNWYDAVPTGNQPLEKVSSKGAGQ